MSTYNNLTAAFWSPFFLAVASGAFAVFWSSIKGWDVVAVVAGLVTLASVVAAYFAAKRGSRAHPAGGSGGSAEALGDFSHAIGGDGGRGVGGGPGGSAVAKGERSGAQGGKGGDA